MKTTERHEQPSDAPNDVADVLNQIAPYWRTIVGVAVVGITAVGLFGFISNSRKAAEEADWTAYFEAVGSQNSEALNNLADSGSVAPWALQAAAQAKLIEGMQNLYTDRDQAKAALEEAAAGFSDAVAKSDSIALLNQRSQWGLAQAQEGLNEMEKAKASYQRLVDRWPGSGLAKRAEERIASLNSPDTQEFYRWFFAQKPTPPPAFNAPGSDQPFNVPSEPNFNIPGITTSGGDDAGADAGDADADATSGYATGSGDADSSETSAAGEGAEAVEGAEVGEGAEAVEVTADP